MSGSVSNILVLSERKVFCHGHYYIFGDSCNSGYSFVPLGFPTCGVTSEFACKEISLFNEVTGLMLSCLMTLGTRVNRYCEP